MLPEESLGELFYANPLNRASDLDGFQFEGDAASSFPLNRWRLEGTRDPGEGQAANLVAWCPQEFPDDVYISWNYRAVQEPGLSILFFSAKGRHGEDVLDPSLEPRNGPYQQYHSGDINALHVSYFRRRWETERAFTTCNLRKSHGFHLVAQGADPIPGVPDQKESYRIWLIKSGAQVRFGVDALECFRWTDPGDAFGPVLGGGKIGFRQMTPLIAEYWDLKVHQLKEPLK
ncbi:DUF1961 family protein [Cerasicoccus fimbriatus]|uniref:DUF1961 family protein n=1 Tax=Cerasicoccus fimbriatus TaxID=3014554 RepID=UPI0022B2F510|nr:DUF1961 family protein [Cerasicoccus sp. TK19100]